MQGDPLVSYGVDLRISIEKADGLVRSVLAVVTGIVLGLLVHWLTATYPASVATAVTTSLVALVGVALERRVLGLAWARFAAEYPQQAREARAEAEEMWKDAGFWRRRI